MTLTIRALSHIVLPVSDLEAALAFYRDLLGLELVMRLHPGDTESEGSIAAGLEIAGLGLPGGSMIELVEGMAESIACSTVVALNVADLEVAQQHVEAAGITPAMPPTEVTPGVTMMFLTDPDGRTVELVEFASGASTNYANLVGSS